MIKISKPIDVRKLDIFAAVETILLPNLPNITQF